MAGEVGEQANARQVLHRLEHVQLHEEAAVEEKDERQTGVKENRREGQLKGGKVDADLGPLWCTVKEFGGKWKWMGKREKTQKNQKSV